MNSSHRVWRTGTNLRTCSFSQPTGVPPTRGAVPKLQALPGYETLSPLASFAFVGDALWLGFTPK